MFSTAIVGIYPPVPVPGKPITVTVQITNNLPFSASGFAQVTIAPLNGGAAQTAEGPPDDLTVQANQNVTQTVTLTAPAYGPYTIYSAFDGSRGQDIPYLSSKFDSADVECPRPSRARSGRRQRHGPSLLDRLQWLGLVQGGPTHPQPAWCQDSGGFSFTDNVAGLPVPKYYVPSATVNLQVDTSFVDDTTKMEFWVPTDDGSGQTIQEMISRMPDYALGNHATYGMRIQEWKPFCSGTATPDCLNEDANTYKCSAPTQGADNEPPITYDNSPDGSSGCWVDLNPSGGVNNTSLYQTDLYGSSANGSDPSLTAQQDRPVSRPLVEPVSLTQVSTYLRTIVQVSLTDSWSATTWQANSLLDTCFIGAAETECQACIPYNDGVSPPCPAGLHELEVIYPTAGAFEYTKVLSPFQVVVTPFALSQLKVLPYTIVYQPPGDFSSAQFKTTTSYAVTLTTGTTTQATNGTIVDLSGSVGTSLGYSGKSGAVTAPTPPPGQAPPADDDNVVTLPAGTFSADGTFTLSSKWDLTTSISVGRSNTDGSSSSSSWATYHQWSASDPTQVPGQKGSYGTAPFWGDRFVLLIHPQFALWTDLAGQPTMSLLGARADRESVVARADGPRPECVLPPAGTVREWLSYRGRRKVLTADDCLELLKLDPFWAVGQNIPQWTGVNLVNDWRAQFATESDYGIDGACSAAAPCGSDLAYKLDDLATQTVTQTAGQGLTYSATVSSLIGTSAVSSSSLQAFGFSLGTSDNDGENTTTTTRMDVTFNQSVTATEQSSTEVTGSLDDHHGLSNDKGPTGSGTAFLGYTPHVVIYRDKMFGSYMFQDPSAPGAPPATP